MGKAFRNFRLRLIRHVLDILILQYVNYPQLSQGASSLAR